MPAAFGTETRAAWCEALLADAPTGSVLDTPQTLEEIADIGDTIDTLCRETASAGLRLWDAPR